MGKKNNHRLWAYPSTKLTLAQVHINISLGTVDWIVPTDIDPPQWQLGSTCLACNFDSKVPTPKDTYSIVAPATLETDQVPLFSISWPVLTSPGYTGFLNSRSKSSLYEVDPGLPTTAPILHSGGLTLSLATVNQGSMIIILVLVDPGCMMLLRSKP